MKCSLCKYNNIILIFLIKLLTRFEKFCHGKNLKFSIKNFLKIPGLENPSYTLVNRCFSDINKKKETHKNDFYENRNRKLENCLQKNLAIERNFR